MGVDLSSLVDEIKKDIQISELKGKKISIDAYNAIYQFLTAIRQPDGTPLMDSSGRITSHLSGVFYRTISLLEEGIIPVYVFDGKPPEMKKEELEKRKRVKEEAEKKLQKAKEEGSTKELKKYSQMATRLTNDMAEESKKLLEAMGIPVVQAPSEGEAEAAYLCSSNYTWAAASQDYDSLLFGAKRLVRNLTLTGKRKLPNKDIYVEIKPEMVELNDLLNKHGITREQLVDIGILIGTDYDPEGIKGIGAKTALRIIKKYGNIEKAVEKGEIPKYILDLNLNEIRSLFLNPNVVNPDKNLELSEPDRDKIINILVVEHNFNSERVNNGIDRLIKGIKDAKGMSRQTGLDQWF
ncbi:flap endonuclease-1 [Acidianus sulfidivorans JP7]|uniref:Flap endonuclease 1 n=1 Tax=Acidianus sulfidivorans JP7 TaxID=619593 RepID=A0A2U9IQL8_9CREN|nr:flap endonuclease-1 [Acidianus sulfidivorans]AWR98276.1 flap endonuclease-1 [Acidianus sulfidivorans JP7]